MRKYSSLFLDFDGVICDSVVECFSSSWYAYFHEYLGMPVSSMNIADKPLYRRLRPMVRNSEDNVVVQHVIFKNIGIQSQADFDAVTSELGAEELKKMRKCFYDTRDFFLSEYRNFWLALNRLFPELLEPVRRVSHIPSVYILSTKKPAFIGEILKYNKIDWDSARILEARGRDKPDIIDEVIRREGFPDAVFIDDQIDHIKNNQHPNITCCLAEWGYVSEAGMQDFSVPHISIADCARLIEDFRQK